MAKKNTGGRLSPYFIIDKDGHVIPASSKEASKHVYSVDELLKETGKITDPGKDKGSS